MDNILIKSIDRQSGTSDNFVIYSNLIIEGTYIVKSCSIPNTIYNVNNTNNQFVLLEGLGSIPVTLPVGNYNHSTFANMLEVTLTSAGLLTYSAVIDPITYVMTVTNTTDSFCAFDFTQIKSFAQQLMGFERDYTGANTSIVSDGIVVLGSPESIGIQIEQSTSRNYENISTDSVGTIYVPLNKAFGSYVTIPSIDLPQYVKFERRERHLRIRIVDTSRNIPLSLNSANYELLLSRCN